MLKKVAIIWANPYNANMGVAALGYSALALVVDVLRKNDQEFKVTFIGSSRSTNDSITIGKNQYEFHNLYGLDYFKVKSILKLFLQYKRHNFLSALSNEYFLDIGEGDSFADIYGKSRFDRILNSKRLFKFFRKKQMLLPQTIGPFENKRFEKKAIKAIEDFKCLFARDRQSYIYAHDILNNRKVKESIDVAFYLPFERNTFEDNKIHVGINVSGLLWNGGYTKNNQFSLKSDYRKLTTDVIEYFRKTENVQVHLVPHVLPADGDVENDRTVSKELLKDYSDIILAPRFNSPIEAKSYISGLDFFTGARMHSTIAAFSSGVPVVPMAYSRKFNGLFNETLKYEFIGDLVNESTEDVFNKVKEGYANRAILKDNIEQSLKEIVSPRLESLKEDLTLFFNS